MWLPMPSKFWRKKAVRLYDNKKYLKIIKKDNEILERDIGKLQKAGNCSSQAVL